MDIRSNRLQTGEKYTLQDLFSGNNRIIIPDLQRDYCWGTEKGDNGENLVKGFIKRLFQNIDKKDMSLGLIYGYEKPAGHILLCDGQQRITTLFLILGMINRKTTDNHFQKLLISDFEWKNDDREPHLHYAIRETSLYFLSDLVCKFFIEDKQIKVNEIKKQPWYFSDYDNDPSIVSMLCALEDINTELEAVDNCTAFGEYISRELSFIYFDMGDRRNGEETFVVINTTGEALSSTENLKPLLITKQPESKRKECSDTWEEWENYFWLNRDKETNDTADNGMKEFFRWITILRCMDFKDESFKKIQKNGMYTFDTEGDFIEINDYFGIVKRAFSDKGLFANNRALLSPKTNENTNDGNKQIDWYQILPVFLYIKRFPDAGPRDILRVKKFFENTARIQNLGKNIETALPEAIRIIRELPDKDICSALEIKDEISTTVLSDEYKNKFKIYRNANGCNFPTRNDIEDKFWEAEEHSIWSGEILPMIEWATKDNVFDYNTFCNLHETFCKIFHDNMDYHELDKCRRAMLTIGLDRYPRRFKGVNYCFCWEYEHWATIIRDNVQVFGKFITELTSKRLENKDIWSGMDDMCKAYPVESDYSEFVKIPELISFCKTKKMQYWEGNKNEWILLAGEKTSGNHMDVKSYELFLEWKKTFNIQGWSISYWPKDSMCVFFEHENVNNVKIVLDIWHISGNKYAINFFTRNDEISETECSSLASAHGMRWNPERNRYCIECEDKNSAIQLAEQIMGEYVANEKVE